MTPQARSVTDVARGKVARKDHHDCLVDDRRNVGNRVSLIRPRVVRYNVTEIGIFDDLAKCKAAIASAHFDYFAEG